MTISSSFMSNDIDPGKSLDSKEVREFQKKKSKKTECDSDKEIWRKRMK